MRHEINYIPDEYLFPKKWSTQNTFSNLYFDTPLTDETVENIQGDDLVFVYENPKSYIQTQLEYLAEKQVYSKYNPKDKEDFEKYLKQYVQNDAELQNWFRKTAALESAFVQKPSTNPSYCGWFQINQNYLSTYTQRDVTKQQFLDSPALQFKAAKNMVKEHLTNIKKDKYMLAWAKQRGYDVYDLLAGSWLLGFGGLKDYVYNGKDGKDGNGTRISQRMKNFHRMYL